MGYSSRACKNSKSKEDELEEISKQFILKNFFQLNELSKKYNINKYTQDFRTNFDLFYFYHQLNHKIGEILIENEEHKIDDIIKCGRVLKKFLKENNFL